LVRVALDGRDVGCDLLVQDDATTGKDKLSVPDGCVDNRCDVGFADVGRCGLAAILEQAGDAGRKMIALFYDDANKFLAKVGRGIIFSQESRRAFNARKGIRVERNLGFGAPA